LDYIDSSEDEEEENREEENEDEKEEVLEESMILVTNVREMMPIDTSCMTIRKTYSLYPADIVDGAIEKELMNTIEKDVFGFVGKVELSKLSRKLVMPTKFFLKNKGSEDAVDLKGRLVGGGNRQDETIYQRKSSPTAGAPTIFVMIVDASKGNKYVVVMDIP